MSNTIINIYIIVIIIVINAVGYFNNLFEVFKNKRVFTFLMLNSLNKKVLTMNSLKSMNYLTRL